MRRRVDMSPGAGIDDMCVDPIGADGTGKIHHRLNKMVGKDEIPNTSAGPPDRVLHRENYGEIHDAVGPHGLHQCVSQFFIGDCGGACLDRG